MKYFIGGEERVEDWWISLVDESDLDCWKVIDWVKAAPERRRMIIVRTTHEIIIPPHTESTKA